MYRTEYPLSFFAAVIGNEFWLLLNNSCLVMYCVMINYKVNLRFSICYHCKLVCTVDELSSQEREGGIERGVRGKRL